MGLQIEDGKGRGYLLEVDSSNRVRAAAVVRKEIVAVSDTNGKAFIAETNFTTTGTNQIFFYLKNDDTALNLHINRIIMNTDSNTMFHLYKATGVPSGGSTVTPTNLNFNSSEAATVTCLGAASITGLSTTKLHHARMLASDTMMVEWSGAIILGNGDAIAIECTTNTTAATCSVEFYFD